MTSLAHARGAWTDNRLAVMKSAATSPLAARHVALARRRTRRARWGWAMFVTIIMLAAMLLQAGCGSTPQVVEYNYESPNKSKVGAPGRSAAEAAAKKPNRVAFDAPDPNDESVSPEAQRLAEQSQRDVDMLMKARQQGASNSAVHSAASDGSVAAPPPAPTSTASQQAKAQPRRAVVWNEPQKPKAAPGPAPAGEASTPPSNAANASGPPGRGASMLGMVDDKPGPAATQPAASQPDAAALRPDRIRQLTVDLARELYAQGAYSDHPLRELAVISAMSVTQPDRRLDPAAIPDLTDEERAVLASLQTFFGSMGTALEKGGDVAGGIAQAASTLRTSLVHEPVLKLPTLALCTRVNGFGDFSPFARYAFLAGSQQKAIVYLEVGDFVSTINQNNEYVTELSQQLTIYSDRDGIPVWKEDWQTATDVTRNKRQDFFTTQIITLPKALSVGKYTLKVRMRDEKSKAEAETSVAFELVADPKMISADAASR